MQYLLIENPGIAEVESFTLLGASNKAGSDAIGQFGSGAKLGPLVLLRHDLPPIIYSSLTRITYGTEAVTFQGATHQQLYVALKRGKSAEGPTIDRVEKLSVVLNYGSTDWKDIKLAAREFVSNALDAVNGNASLVAVQIVDTTRARAGYTRVYLPLHPDLQDFHENLSEWFLHFSGRAWRNNAVLDKDAPSPAKIYRRGVLVRTVHTDSLFDYNLNDLTLDEARLAGDFSVRWSASKALEQVTTPATVAKLLLADTCWEHNFDLNASFVSGVQAQKQSGVWKGAQELAFGGKTVIATKTQDTTLAERKGYSVRRVPETVYNAAVRNGLRTVNQILTVDEQEGRRVDDVTHLGVIAIVRHVWEKIEPVGYTRGETFPNVFSFYQDQQSGTRTLGYYRDGGVYINRCLVPDTVAEYGVDNIPSKELFAVALEELAHYVTKATDNSRDFQEFFLQLAVSLLLK